jgi:signal transduction histidine kinase
MRVRLVHLEDDEVDRNLVARTLRGEGIDCVVVGAECRGDFERALDDPPDLILSDYSIPGLSGHEAQGLARRKCPDVPFVFVSGSIGEERAVERLKDGATDYVLKDRLDTLGTAVKRALREAEERRRRAAAETALRQLNAQLEARVIERTRDLVAANEDLKRARLEADRANAAKSEFLARVSHDLRTPLNAIMGFAQLLNLDGLAADQVDSINHILRSGEHLLSLINEVLDISRIESGHLTLSLEPVSVIEAVDYALDLIKPMAGKRGISVSGDAARELYVLADRQRLNQILLNLLSNAVKYNRDGGMAMVRASGDGDHVQITVTDTGAGIPPEKLTLMFTPFERLGAEQTGIEGTGLGLALSKRLAAEMKGSLTVESQVDRGTVFTVVLPRSHGEGFRELVAPPVPVARADYAGSVLYIEDNASNVVLMERLLARRPGVRLEHAQDGRSGLEMLKRSRPNLVILDLHLSDMPGEEVLRRIWSDPSTRAVPVAVLSADASSRSQRRLRASGAVAYLTKPFDITEVLRLIDGIVGGAPAHGSSIQ